MDERLRILRRRAEADASNLPEYVRALERCSSGTAYDGPIKIWVVLFCHDSTDIDDARVFLTREAADNFIMNDIVVQMRAVNADGGLPAETLALVEHALLAGDGKTISQLYEAMTDETWFEIAEKELGP